jgi:hypothetical protein
MNLATEKRDSATSRHIKADQGVSREIKDTLSQRSLHSSLPEWLALIAGRA